MAVPANLLTASVEEVAEEVAVPTSLLITSLEEVAEALARGFTFPAIAIPFGAHETTPCRFFGSSDDMDSEDLAVLLDSSYPMMDKVRRVHLISRPVVGISRFNPGPTFYLDAT
ncbi:MAG TPA: hypothetical protein VFY28_02470 [Candidatus Paceibacterota bacterium]|nr:hypothetical protein [Candidatus Paceibacterota bacterium]